jgi:hypothetical protein
VTGGAAASRPAAGLGGERLLAACGTGSPPERLEHLLEFIGHRGTAIGHVGEFKKIIRLREQPRRLRRFVSRPLGDVVVIMPPLSITLDELDLLLLAAEAGIRAATAT